jgi:hypothetical protein
MYYFCKTYVKHSTAGFMEILLYVKGKTVPVLNEAACHEDVSGNGSIAPRHGDIDIIYYTDS